MTYLRLLVFVVVGMMAGAAFEVAQAGYLILAVPLLAIIPALIIVQNMLGEA